MSDIEGTKDGRTRPCHICHEPIGDEAMVVMRPTDQVNVTEAVFHARCAHNATLAQSADTKRPFIKAIHGWCQSCHKDRWLNDQNVCRQCAAMRKE